MTADWTEQDEAEYADLVAAHQADADERARKLELERELESERKNGVPTTQEDLFQSFIRKLSSIGKFMALP